MIGKKGLDLELTLKSRKSFQCVKLIENRKNISLEELQMNWLDEICKANAEFKKQVDLKLIPVERKPCTHAVITCMDPRINLESIGIPPCASTGEIKSHSRVIRTIGALHEIRSLVIGIYLAGFKEIAVIMHTDCGCSLALEKIDIIIENIKSNLTKNRFETVQSIIGKPFRENLINWLGAFEDPYATVAEEIRRIKESAFIPENQIIHGLVYDLASGGIDVVVNGYKHISASNRE